MKEKMPTTNNRFTWFYFSNISYMICSNHVHAFWRLIFSSSSRWRFFFSFHFVHHLFASKFNQFCFNWPKQTSGIKRPETNIAIFFEEFAWIECENGFCLGRYFLAGLFLWCMEVKEIIDSHFRQCHMDWWSVNDCQHWKIFNCLILKNSFFKAF
jgi:hypothetical protein